MQRVAALFVDERGVYATAPEVDVWGVTRDARTYAGPWPVVAHPPCERWGRYWYGGPSAKVRRQLGDDGGCFASALASVRRWGGVIEHPRDSKAWRVFGLNAPPVHGGWIMADWHGGWTCCVEQGHYGHRARKATWLYAFGVALPELTWGPSVATALIDPGYKSRMHRTMTRPPPWHIARVARRAAAVAARLRDTHGQGVALPRDADEERARGDARGVPRRAAGDGAHGAREGRVTAAAGTAAAAGAEGG